MRLWQLYVLIFVTFGVFAIVWAARTAKDFQRNLDPGIRPWRYGLGLLLAVGYPFVAFRLASNADRLVSSIGRSAGPPRWIITTLAGVALVVLLAFRPIDDKQIVVLFAAGLVAFAMAPIPWLLIQRKLNLYKDTLSAVRWLTPVYTLTGTQVAILLAGGCFWAIGGLGAWVELGRERGEPLEAGGPVRGESGLYSVSPSDGSWIRVPIGTIQDGTDLELYGSTTETQLLAYVSYEDTQSLDDLVDSRRRLLRDDFADFVVDEERVLLPEAGIAVSFTRYSGLIKYVGFEETWWVAVLALEDATIEILAKAPGGPGDSANLERIVKSLRLTSAR